MRRGEVHERAVLERFRADGLDVVEISAAADGTRATAEAIRGGARAVYQGTLTRDGPGAPLFGRPDFLVRADLLAAPDGQPRPAGAHYEVVDAKLARSAKARAVLQTAFYSQLLAGLQDPAPRWMHLALGDGEFVPFRVNDYAAYERQTRLCGYSRRVDLDEATRHLIAFEAALEDGTAASALSYCPTSTPRLTRISIRSPVR